LSAVGKGAVDACAHSGGDAYQRDISLTGLPVREISPNGVAGPTLRALAVRCPIRPSVAHGPVWGQRLTWPSSWAKTDAPCVKYRV